MGCTLPPPTIHPGTVPFSLQLVTQAGTTTPSKDNVTIQQEKQQKQATAYSSALSIAKGQFSQLVSTGFMLWMVGTSLQIFPLMMLFMACMTPIRALLSIHEKFQWLEHNEISLFIPKILYVILNVCCLFMCIYKLYTMNLIPLSWWNPDVMHFIPEIIPSEIVQFI